MENFPSAKIIAHSKAPNGEELITMEIELHRFILPEFNTHRCFSRNFQSSRAVPVDKMIEQVRTSPAMPVHWGKNQRGMVAEEECSNKIFVEIPQMWSEWDVEMMTAQEYWEHCSDVAADLAENLAKEGYHKQIVNRLLEPFMKTKGVVTATREGYESFFKLRSHKDAQPEIKALSDKMKTALEDSLPEDLQLGEYHLPYVDWTKDDNGIYFVGDSTNLSSMEEAIKVSTSCCAQVSYRVLDESLEKATKIYDMLNLPEKGVYPEDPPHFSPTEHVAVVTDEYDMADNKGIIDNEYLTYSGNFHSKTFGQYRKFLERGDENLF